MRKALAIVLLGLAASSGCAWFRPNQNSPIVAPPLHPSTAKPVTADKIQRDNAREQARLLHEEILREETANEP